MQQRAVRAVLIRHGNFWSQVTINNLRHIALAKSIVSLLRPVIRAVLIFIFFFSSWPSTAAATAAAEAEALPAPVVLITGSNRGIGFELAKQYAERGWSVIATCRTPDGADALQSLASANANITIEALDVTDRMSIVSLADR